MNLIQIPFHGYNTMVKEGFRTRDAHIYNEFTINKSINKLIVIDRPLLFFQSFSSSKIIYKNKLIKIFEENPNTYLIQYKSLDIIAPIIKKQLWYIGSYSKMANILFKDNFYRELIGNNCSIVTHNLFSYNFIKRMVDLSSSVIFDAYDNLAKFVLYSHINKEVIDLYNKFAKHKLIKWISNTEYNREYYSRLYGVKDTHIVKNGCEINKFLKSYPKPDKLKNIIQPIIGFAGKITELINTELFNNIVQQNYKYSFVIIGKILSNKVFNEITKHPNVYYLGDIHYEQYPSYITNFDILLLPYYDEKQGHGQDSIKLYEYMSTKNHVISTSSETSTKYMDYIDICNTVDEVNDSIQNYISGNTNANKRKGAKFTFSWGLRAKEILNYL